jgi:hypothetical protein
MTSSRPSAARRSFGEHFQATFGQMDTRKLRRRGLLALGVMAVLVAGAASADWHVYDERVEEVLIDIRDNYIQKDGGSVTTHLKNVNDRLSIKGDDFKAGGDDDSKPVEPKKEEDRLTDKEKPTAATDVAEINRCPAPKGGGTGIPQQQNVVCKEVYKTEIARYRFSLEMYDLAEKRNKKLQEIIAERNALNEKDFGKMEENTNKLVALQAQMDNDRDRYNSYMQAYQARMEHLVKTKELLAEQAMNGNGKSNPMGGLVGGAVLLTALKAAGHSSERDNPFN